MAELDVSGSFLITIGRGNGPETWVAVSVSSEDGKPASLKFPKRSGGLQPVEIFVALSAMFGAFPIPLRIVEVQAQPAGFYALRLEAPADLGARLDATRPSTLGIIVDDGIDRGQALACSCGGAEVTSWLAGRTQAPGQKS
jgi:hypothetical protein